MALDEADEQQPAAHAPVDLFTTEAGVRAFYAARIPAYATYSDAAALADSRGFTALAREYAALARGEAAPAAPESARPRRQRTA